MKNHIEISLEWGNQQADFAVPSNVTPKRLIELLTQAFESQKKQLPKGWSFTVKGKIIDIHSSLTLKELGLSDGEILELKVGETHAMYGR